MFSGSLRSKETHWAWPGVSWRRSSVVFAPSVVKEKKQKKKSRRIPCPPPLTAPSSTLLLSCDSLGQTPQPEWTVSRTSETGAWMSPSPSGCSCMARWVDTHVLYISSYQSKLHTLYCPGDPKLQWFCHLRDTRHRCLALMDSKWILNSGWH